MARNIRRQGLIQEQFLTLKSKYPDLYLLQDAFSSEIYGTLSMHASYQGVELKEQYEIRIKIPPNYPESVPVSWETGSKIPFSGPRVFHKNPDASLCLASPVEVVQKFFRKKNLLNYVDSLLIPYLFSYSYLKRYRKLPFGELRHGTEGLIQFYQNYFQVPIQECVVGFLAILGQESFSSLLRCPCGSGKAIAICHEQKIRKLHCYRNCHDFVREFFDIGAYFSVLERYVYLWGRLPFIKIQKFAIWREIHED